MLRSLVTFSQHNPSYQPSRPQCPVFAEELAKASSAGVDVLCAKVHWNTNGDCFYHGMIDVDMKK